MTECRSDRTREEIRALFDKLPTTGNAGAGAEAASFEKLGLVPMAAEEPARVAAQ